MSERVAIAEPRVFHRQGVGLIGVQAGSAICPIPDPARIDIDCFRALMGTVVPFQPGRLIYSETDPADYLYVVMTGFVRGYRITSEGRRQIVAFYVPGDLFGFERGDDHTVSADAVNDVRLKMIKRAVAMGAAARDQSVGRQLWDALAAEQYRDQEHIVRLGKSARQRVASFLLELSRRSPAAGRNGLPMSRQDIADHLDLTIETVSRMLTQLKSVSAIAIADARRITIRNTIALERLASDAE